MLKTATVLLGVLFLGAPIVWAESSGNLDPNVIRKDLEGLRTLYTDQHPDVILLQRKLEKAEELKRQRELRRNELQGQPGQLPSVNEDTDSLSAGPSSSVD